MESAFEVAVVGVGMGAAQHLRSLHDLRAVYPLTWVCARDAQRLAAVSLPEGVQRSTRLDDILQDPRMRAVLVLTPPAAHLDVVRQSRWLRTLPNIDHPDASLFELPLSREST